MEKNVVILGPPERGVIIRIVLLCVLPFSIITILYLLFRTVPILMILTILMLAILAAVLPFLPTAGRVYLTGEKLTLEVVCPLKKWIITARDADIRPWRDVISFRIIGISAPSFKLGVFNDPDGKLIIALSNVKRRTCLLVPSEKGRLFALGLREAEEIYEMFMEGRERLLAGNPFKAESGG